MRGFLIDEMRPKKFLRLALTAKNHKDARNFVTWSQWIMDKTDNWTWSENSRDDRIYICSWHMVNVWDPIKYVELK